MSSNQFLKLAVELSEKLKQEQEQRAARSKKLLKRARELQKQIEKKLEDS